VLPSRNLRIYGTVRGPVLFLAATDHAHALALLAGIVGSRSADHLGPYLRDLTVETCRTAALCSRETLQSLESILARGVVGELRLQPSRMKPVTQYKPMDFIRLHALGRPPEDEPACWSLRPMRAR
jgi:hypothetical protein